MHVWRRLSRQSEIQKGPEAALCPRCPGDDHGRASASRANHPSSELRTRSRTSPRLFAEPFVKYGYFSVEPAKRDDARTLVVHIRDDAGLCVFPSRPNDGALGRASPLVPHILERNARPRIEGVILDTAHRKPQATTGEEAFAGEAAGRATSGADRMLRVGRGQAGRGRDARATHTSALSTCGNPTAGSCSLRGRTSTLSCRTPERRGPQLRASGPCGRRQRRRNVRLPRRRQRGARSREARPDRLAGGLTVREGQSRDCRDLRRDRSGDHWGCCICPRVRGCVWRVRWTWWVLARATGGPHGTRYHVGRSPLDLKTGSSTERMSSTMLPQQPPPVAVGVAAWQFVARRPSTPTAGVSMLRFEF